MRRDLFTSRLGAVSLHWPLGMPFVDQKSEDDMTLSSATAGGVLTGRSLVVLQLFARRYTTDQIAFLLGVSASDVDSALLAASESLQARDPRVAAAIAKRRGLIV
jgi:DNA-binding NarL/FixJ family response regulator